MLVRDDMHSRNYKVLKLLAGSATAARSCLLTIDNLIKRGKVIVNGYYLYRGQRYSQ